MKFCMVTTFFGAHSFGGDAAYVDRLSRALCRRGHEVHVFHCADAFNAVRGTHPLRPYEPPAGLHLHRLESRFGILSPIAPEESLGRPGDWTMHTWIAKSDAFPPNNSSYTMGRVFRSAFQHKN